jgi:23S rRNA pseudouridine1911/1915/1917 synthase
MALPDPAQQPVDVTVPDEHAGARLDWFIAQTFPSYSRTHIRKAINLQEVRVNGRRAKAAMRMTAGDVVNVVLPELPKEGPQPAAIPLEILYEDAAIAVINKPPGMVVHPGRGHWEGTLASALRYHFDELSEYGGPTRPGIVHRLDRDTSGVILIAKSDQAHKLASEQFENRTVTKEYFAITAGVPDHDRDLIDLPIGPHPYQREKMAIRRDHPAARPAQSFYEVQQRFAGFAAVRIAPKTGRTHQIRLHLASIGCPVLCDRLYGGRARLTKSELTHRPGAARLSNLSDANPQAADDSADEDVLICRQALHAIRLTIRHPLEDRELTFEAPLPEDMRLTLAALEQFRALR